MYKARDVITNKQISSHQGFDSYTISVHTKEKKVRNKTYWGDASSILKDILQKEKKQKQNKKNPCLVNAHGLAVSPGHLNNCKLKK